MNLTTIRDKLLEVTENVYHFIAPDKVLKTKENHIVWSEEGQSEALYYNNKMSSQTIIGSISYFTHEEFDDNFNQIQLKLNELCSQSFGWKLDNIDYIREIGVIQYIWSWKMVIDVG